MDPPDPSGTVFYLESANEHAAAVIEDPANEARRCYAPHIDPDKPVLRIGLDQQPKNPPYLVTFGRREDNDVVLNQRFSRNDQCYFDFNRDTGELLLHDISRKHDTHLCDVITVGGSGDKVEKHVGRSQIWKSPRKCVVVLSPDLYGNPNTGAVQRQWFFIMSSARFLIRTPAWQDHEEAVITQKKLAFAGQVDPNQTLESTLQRIFAAGLQALNAQGLATTYKSESTIQNLNTHNTRFRTPLEPADLDRIRFLEKGGKGKSTRSSTCIPARTMLAKSSR
ncbi:hypothetical protein J3459_003993 [Metarhizium acridum]|nr:hypothetical protein J3458_002783 [Metarhizium acridum]KAG8428360.1 hypothetical protein J3459_003993 [Metarhizium acridum]